MHPKDPNKNKGCILFAGGKPERKMSNSTDEPTLADKHKHGTTPSVFEVITKLVVPGLALAATLVAQFRGQRLLIWILSATVLVSLGVSFGPWLTAQLRALVLGMLDERIVRSRFTDFRALVRDFGKFVSGDSSHTLHGVVSSEVFSNHYRNFAAAIDLPDSELLSAWWHCFNATVQGIQPSRQTFAALQREFAGLINYYHSRCIGPVFGLRSLNFQEWLLKAPKGKLNLFRERYLRFLDDYEEYLKSLQGSFFKLRVTVVNLERPEAL